MELVGFVAEMLEEYATRLFMYMDDLTTDELNWRADASSNSIAFIVWHTTRVEDRWIQVFCQGKSDLWATGHWFEKLGVDEKQPLVRLKPDEVVSFPKLTSHELKSYFEAVRAETQQYLANLNPENLETSPGNSPFGGSDHPFAQFTIHRMFRQLIQEEIQHLGQVGYLRGLQRGLDK